MQIEEYQRGYHNSLYHMQKKYNLRRRNVHVTLNKKRQSAQRDAQDKETILVDQNKEKEIVILSRDKTNEASTNNTRKDKEIQSEG